jgi:hypothetical protein
MPDEVVVMGGGTDAQHYKVAPRAGPPDHPDVYLTNLTPDRLDLGNAGRQRIVLPPLATKFSITGQQYEELGPARLTDSPKVEVEIERQADDRDVVARVFGIGAVVGLTAGLITWFLAGVPFGLLAYVAVELVAVAVAWNAAGSSGSTGSESSTWLSAGGRSDASGEGHTTRTDSSTTAMRRPDILLEGFAKSTMPTLVAVMGFGVAILVSWQIETGKSIAGIFDPALIEDLAREDSMVLIQFALRALFLGLVTTFPAAMYFTFEKQRGAALRTRFLLDAFRLDTRFRTVNDIRARYGARMRDVFGLDGDSNGEAGPSRVASLRYNAPVLISTIALSLVVVLVYAFYKGDAEAGFVVPLMNFLPYPYVVSFALLGAYFYGLNTAVRGYVRGDLQPKTYSQITGRILKVFVLSALVWIVDVYWLPDQVSIVAEEAVGATDETLATSLADAIEAAPSGNWTQGALLALAFFVGIVPNTILTWLYEKVRHVFKIDSAKLVEAQPLTHLQGVDLYDRARLEQEGVTNLEALAHGEIVDLMLQTRIPTGRLVDWLDQAVLLLYLEDVPKDRGGDHDLAYLLRSAGFRTASQLVCDCRGLCSWNEPCCASLMTTPLTSSETERVCAELVRGLPYDDQLKKSLTHAVRGLAGEPCMRRILSWRANPAPRVQSLDSSDTDVVAAHCHLVDDAGAHVTWPGSPARSSGR